jgi:hypothetical protein
MFLNNNIISNNKINNYDLLHNELTSISYTISFLKESYKNKLYPTSSDIIKFIHFNNIINYQFITTFIKNNTLNNKITHNIKKNCLISQIYDAIDNDFIEYNTKIFEHIYIINYSNNFYKNNNNITFIQSNNKTYKFDLLLLANDIKYNFQYIVFLHHYQKLGLQKNDKIILSNTTLHKYFQEIKSKYNVKILNNLFNLKNQLFNLRNDFFIYKSNITICIYDNENNSSTIDKTYVTPLTNINNPIHNKILLKNIFKKYNNQNLDNINNFEDFIYNYFNVLDLKLKFNEFNTFMQKKYTFNKFTPKKLTFSNKNNSFLQFNNFDYQLYNQSFFILFDSTLTNDFILMLYFIKLSKKLLKKLFILWNHDFNLDNLFDEEFYYCNVNYFDNITFCKDIDYNFSLDNITYVNTKLLNIFNLDDFKFLKIINLMNINNKYKEYINNNNVLDVFNYNEDIINKFVNLDKFSIINLKKYENNKDLDIIRILSFINSNKIISDKNDKILKYFDSINFNFLIQSNNTLNNNSLEQNINLNNDFLLITFNFNKQFLNKNINNKYINKIFICNCNLNFNNYTINNINYNCNLSVVYNSIIKNSDNKNIIISDTLLDNLFFYKLVLNNSYYYDQNTLVFTKNQFKKINGFNEDLNETYTLDFIKRLESLNYNNTFDFENNYSLTSFWGLENQQSGKLLQISKNNFKIL